MTLRPSGFDAALIAARPRLMAFARSLVKRVDLAQDLVQETIAKALQKSDQFEPGSNITAWLFTILRNECFSRARRSGREVADVDGILASLVPTPAAQIASYDLQVLFGRMERLSFEQRASLELVALDGMTYEEVADILGIPAGTVKSQVSRARSMLSAFYEGRP